MEMAARKVGENGLILSAIFSNCDISTLNVCSLVNKQWLKEACAFKRLQAHSWQSDEKAGLIESIKNSPSIPSSHVQCIGVMREEVALSFGSKLVSLHLTQVGFRDIIEVRKVIYLYFPIMRELVLDQITVWKNKKHALNKDVFKVHENMKVLKIVRSTDDDAFAVIHFKEIFSQFPNLQELTYDCQHLKWDKTKTHRMKFFNAIRLADIRLSRLQLSLPPAYQLEPPEVLTAMSSYVNTKGATLIAVGGKWGSQSTIQKLFEDFDNKNLRSLTINEANLSTFGRGTFDRLTHVLISTVNHDSLEFLERMPKLGCVQFLEPSKFQPTLLKVSSVQEIHLINAYYPEEIEDVFKIFPSVNKLEIIEHHEVRLVDDWIDEWAVHVGIEGVIPFVEKYWPKIISVKIRTPCGLRTADYGSDDEMKEEGGNVSLKKIRTLLNALKDLEIFEYSDDFENYSEGIHDITEDFDSDGSWEYGSFAEWSEERDKIPVKDQVLELRMCFGEAAINCFLDHPKLRTLRLKTVCIPEERVKLLRQRFSCLDIERNIY